MRKYRLTKAATEDLISIAEYGDEYFGVEQSDRYRDQLKTHFLNLAKYPMHYPAVEYIQNGYRRSVCGHHSIYYQVNPAEIVIVRILGRQDPVDALRKVKTT